MDNLINMVNILKPDDVVNLTNLDFSLSLNGSGSAGSFYKAYDDDYYYKLSYSLGKEFGYESVNEVLTSRLCNLLGLHNADYELVHAKIRILNKEYITYLCKSYNYKKPYESRTTLEAYCAVNDINHNYIQNFERLTIFKDLLNMIMVDYIIHNRDRHGANIELLQYGDDLRLAPIYDCGSSLLAPLQYDMGKINSYSLLNNGPVNNYLVATVWEDVLCILKEYYVKVPVIDLNMLPYKDLYGAFGSYTCILDKEIEMIKERYAYAKKILNS